MALAGEQIELSDIRKALDTQKVEDLKMSKVFDGPTGSVSPAVVESYLKEMPEDSQGSVHFVDVSVWEGEFDFQALETALDTQKEPKYSDLPMPLCPKAPMPVGMTMQLAIADIPKAG